MKILILSISPLVAAFVMGGCGGGGVQTSTSPHTLTLTSQYPSPVLTVNSPGAEGVTYGFEGGRVIKIYGVYHLLITEFIANPSDPAAKYTKTNLAHWSSEDKLHWQREGTLLDSTGDRSGVDPTAVRSGIMPVYDDQAERWEIFSTEYRSQPDDAPYPPASGKSDPNPFLFPDDSKFSRDPHIYYEYSGRAFQAKSEVTGLTGIGGPYGAIQVMLEMGPNCQPWEGLFGDESFEPYQIGGTWFAFFGSAHTEGTYQGNPYSGRTMMGLATSTALDGPWQRLDTGNPLDIESEFGENPVVSALQDGSHIAVYNAPNWYPGYNGSQIGYTTSIDGIHWSKGIAFTVQPQGPNHWAFQVRTPLGLVPEPDGTYTLFYTGNNGGNPWVDTYHMAVGFVTVAVH